MINLYISIQSNLSPIKVLCIVKSQTKHMDEVKEASVIFCQHRPHLPNTYTHSMALFLNPSVTRDHSHPILGVLDPDADSWALPPTGISPPEFSQGKSKAPNRTLSSCKQAQRASPFTDSAAQWWGEHAGQASSEVHWGRGTLNRRAPFRANPVASQHVKQPLPLGSWNITPEGTLELV